MKCIAYLSSPIVNPTKNELAIMGAQFEKMNTQRSLSGFLIYDHKKFFQYLEGPEEEVNTLFNKIELDSRHTLIAQATANTTYKRFSSWGMRVLGFSNLERILPENELIDLISFSAKHPKLLPQWELLAWHIIDQIAYKKENLI